MDRAQVLRLLVDHKLELVRRFSVADLALFGATARGSARGDIDILVSFDGAATSGSSSTWKACSAAARTWCPRKPSAPSCALTSSGMRCMSERAPREWRLYVEDMLGLAEKVCTYTEGLDQAAFVASGLNYDATVTAVDPGHGNLYEPLWEMLTVSYARRTGP